MPIQKIRSAAGGARAVERCKLLGDKPYSDYDDGLYRGYLTPAYRHAQFAVAAWMEDAGMRVSIDPAANLIGRYEGAGDGPPLIIGSHLDSIRNAGFYDGPLGIMLGVECVATLQAQGRRLPFPIEIYAFGDEEGSRFPAAMLTSRAVAGQFDPASLALADENGTPLRTALADYRTSLAGSLVESSHTADDEALGFASARHGPALAYLEAHIEQGPVLEAGGYALGTVTGIAAQRRYACHVTGVAGHAGTNTMDLRRDALTAAAAMILAAEAVAQAGPDDLVATVGRLEVLPGAPNAVPGAVVFTLDVRAGTDATRDAAASAIVAECQAIAAARGLTFSFELLQDLPASPCSTRLAALMDESIAAAGAEPRRLVSGAGHDAMIMADLCPTAMLFIRCTGGISHNPAEDVIVADVEVALKAMLHFIEGLAA